MPPVVRQQSRSGPPAPKVGDYDDKTGSVVGRIRPIEFDPQEGIKVMLYGQSGSGKTSLWGTFTGPILAVICSGSVNPGECRTLDAPEFHGKVSEVVLHETEELEKLAHYVKSGGGRFKTVVLDHCTAFQDMILAEVLGLADVPVQKTWGTATQQQWGQISLLAKERLRHLLNLTCNVVIISQERVFNGKEDVDKPHMSDVIRPFVGAAQTPTLTGWLNTCCDYVCQTFKRQHVDVQEVDIAGQKMRQETPTKGVEYCLRVGPSVEATTKFRIPRHLADRLPDVIVDPTYDKLIGLIRGKSPAKPKK